MDVLLNIIILCLSLMIMPSFYEREEFTLFFIVLGLCVILVFNAFTKIMEFFNGRFYFDDGDLRFYDNYTNIQNEYQPIIIPNKTSKKISYQSPEDKFNEFLSGVESKCKLNESRMEIIDLSKNLHNRIEKLKCKFKLIEPKSNKVEKVQEEKKTITLVPIKDILTEKINKDENAINLSNKPRLEIKLDEERENNYTSKTETIKNAKNVIMVVNEYFIDDNRRKIYDTIINLFKSKKYATSKIYRLLKSIKYIDILPSSINIFINYSELDSLDEIPMIEIREAIRDSINNIDMNVLFFTYKHRDIFEYYIVKKIGCHD